MRIFFRTLIAALWIGIFFAFLSTTHIFRPIKDDKQVLNIFSWPEILNPEIIKKFERETGITVVRHYYTSNEELLVKLKASQGKGYDLIIPSDYAVKKLIEENLLKPIDHSQLDFVATLNPKLMCQDFDPQNTYSLPFIWEVLGFGIDRDAYQDLPFDPSWQEIFCPTHPNTKISMVSDPLEAIDMTSRHLFKNREKFGPQEIALIRTKLLEQKRLVEAYAGVRGDYLLTTKNATVAVIPSSYILRAAKNYSHIDFVLPKDYCFLSIENMCIPAASKNETLTYLFLNYLYSPEIFSLETNIFQNFPATTNVRPFIKNSPLLIKTLDALESYDGTFYYTRELLTEKESRTLWVELKSS